MRAASCQARRFRGDVSRANPSARWTSMWQMNICTSKVRRPTGKDQKLKCPLPYSGPRTTNDQRAWHFVYTEAKTMGQLYTVRTGWEAERLAHYLLSRFSFVAQPTTISDDVGSDFYCTIFDILDSKPPTVQPRT